MKMNSNAEVGTVISGDLSEKNFGILANDKMFNILSSKIYSDKISAPIRELSCNAYDAHVAAKKKDIPFNVHIPTIDERFFSVEDFGPGMDAYEIEELYTTYGYSSKANSNRFVGCLGLGSKSPFAYTDSFRIVSRKKGKEYLYQCMIENGVPKLIKFNEKKTEEHSGVKIEFNVERLDIWSFRYKSEEIFRYFNPRPNFNINLDINEYPEFKYDISIPDKGTYTHHLLMGNVCYPYNIEHFDKHPKYGKFYKQFNSVLTTLRAQIGDVEIAASREVLEMSERTMDFIARKHIEYSNKLLDEIKSRQSACSSKLDYLFEYGRFICEKKFLDRSDFEAEVKAFSIPVEGEINVVEIHNCNGRHEHERNCYTFKDAIRFQPYHFYNNTVKFVYVPEGRLISSYGINEEADSCKCLIVYLFNDQSLKKTLEALNIKIYTKDDFASSQPVRERTYQLKELEGVTQCQVLTYYDSSIASKGFQFSTPMPGLLERLNEAETVFYVKTKNRKVDQEAFKALEDEGMSPDCLKYVWKYLQSKGYKHIIGATEDRIKKLSKDAKYVNLIDYTLSHFSKNSDAYKEAMIRVKMNQIRDKAGLLFYLKFQDDFLTDEVRELIGFFEVNNEKQFADEVGYVSEMYSLQGRNYSSEWLYAFYEFLKEKYPMLTFIRYDLSRYTWSDRYSEIKKIQDYIDLVDENARKNQ